MKKCSKCKQEKELNNFGIDKKECDGLNRVCKQCRQSFSKEHSKRLYEKNKLWKENNVDKIKEYQKEYSKVWNQNNVDKIKEYSKEYYDNNVEKLKEYISYVNTQETNLNEFESRIQEYKNIYFVKDNKDKEIKDTSKTNKNKNV